MSAATASACRESLVGKKVLIPLIGCYGRVLRVVANPRSGFDELRVMHDKDGTISTDLWPLAMVREVAEGDGRRLCWERSDAGARMSS